MDCSSSNHRLTTDIVKLEGKKQQVTYVNSMCYSSPFLFKSHKWYSGRIFLQEKGFSSERPAFPVPLVIIMEILQCILNKAVKDRQLMIHPKCRKLNITHLTFGGGRPSGSLLRGFFFWSALLR